MLINSSELRPGMIFYRWTGKSIWGPDNQVDFPEMELCECIAWKEDEECFLIKGPIAYEGREFRKMKKEELGVMHLAGVSISYFISNQQEIPILLKPNIEDRIKKIRVPVETDA